MTMRRLRPRLARLEHALQRRLRDLGEGRGDLGLLRGRYPVVLDGRHAGLADTAQQCLAKVGIVDGGDRMVVQSAADGFRMRPAIDHMGRAQPHELAARVRQFLPGPYLRLRGTSENYGEKDGGERAGADHCVLLF